MTHVDRLRCSPGNFRALTGLTPDEADDLLAEVEPRHAVVEARRPGRARAVGADARQTLPVGDRLLMLLVYYRTHVTHKFLGFRFGRHDGNVGRNVNPLGPLLAGVSP